MQHTPGPWIIANSTEIHDKVTEFDENGARIGSTANLIATVDYFNTYADARLIAAAPDLLDALIEASSLFDNCPETLEYVGTYEVVHAAIRKALGA